jgi:hypothetical protein
MFGSLLYAYYAFALISTPINDYLMGDMGEFISISYLPLALLMAISFTKSLSMQIPRGFASLLVWFGVITLITMFHLAQGLNIFLIKYPFFLLFALVLSRNIRDEHVRGLVNITFACSCLYFLVGAVLWYVNVYGQLITPASFTQKMLFHKQDYTIVLTLLSGIFLFDLVMSDKEMPWRKLRMVISAVILTTGVTVFYIKSLIVIGVTSIVLLDLLRVRRSRPYLVMGALTIFTVFLTHEFIVVSRILPDHITSYVAWMFDDRLLSAESGRYVDSLGMRVAIFYENFGALTANLGNAAVGIGRNTAVDMEYLSRVSGQTHSLPTQLESGALTILVYTGVVGMLGYLFMYWAGFRIWRRASMKYNIEGLPLFATAVSINVALFSSNVFQDNLSSVTWCWLGILWYFAHKGWRFGDVKRKPELQLNSRRDSVPVFARRYGR